MMCVLVCTMYVSCVFVFVCGEFGFKILKKYIYIFTLKKRNLRTNDTSGSESIASRVKGLCIRRPVKKKQKQPRPPVTALASPGSKQHE